MSTRTSSDPFESAASYLSNSPALSGVSNDVKLELYALYKSITVSPTPQSSRPSLFDFTGRAKWDAWDKLGRQSNHADPEIWKARYLEIARSLGWKEGGQGDSLKRDSPEEWENTTGVSGSSSRGEGMGVSVSTILKPPTSSEDVNHIHGFALLGDDEGLIKFLDEHPDQDLNVRDSYGYTALHLAADRGNESIIKILLPRGADPTIEDQDQFTALGLAEIAGHENIVSLLKQSYVL